ncbi:hypothetical protein ABEB36_010215 [Hypothenemus hampei]|uniref:Uncharacterized protein n=1 Tax=Hypothenemus hampei TaxID=57062 RepID=A0ABD1EIW0_HYPHA
MIWCTVFSIKNMSSHSSTDGTGVKYAVKVCSLKPESPCIDGFVYYTFKLLKQNKPSPALPQGSPVSIALN